MFCLLSSLFYWIIDFIDFGLIDFGLIDFGLIDFGLIDFNRLFLIF
ncbi:hypothetical protein [Helicobacter pylori]